jgi:hypothetical protein
MSRKIFGEFVELFPKGLSPFKIQVSLKLDLFTGFLFQDVSFQFIYHHVKVGNF